MYSQEGDYCSGLFLWMLNANLVPNIFCMEPVLFSALFLGIQLVPLVPISLFLNFLTFQRHFQK